MTSYPWQEGTATGIGSYPGDDPAEALRIVLGELPEMPHLPELPARGPGADLTGRTAGLLVDMPVRVEPSGWRFSDRPGRDTLRSHDHLERDLDVLEEIAGGHDGPFKIQVCGPWTLAATIELRNGDRALKDAGAVRDLAASLAEGVAAHVADVRRRLPAARIVVQLDEPGLPAVLAGTIPTASGFSRLRAIEEPVAEDTLRTVIDAAAADDAAYPIVHCCARNVPYALLRGAGAQAISVDLRMVPRRDDDAVGETIDAGTGLLLGAVPATDTALPSLRATAEPVKELWRRLGFPPARLARQVVITPACGMAGASPRHVREALRRCRDTARMIFEDAE
ncbi:cobalamin-independent methionine synthase catalytic subunit [Actinomadura pelletieri DSM 43383]|uniref:Cobalamin-independent methionine synthase catalytic subunit n=1 Tax=Actinomadura pelletieri DSM 43383 TaxID=1120940 RepID=A0A495QQ82_9ACTN|nr:methionine synthase [Actinomadura pelletieri]RKS75111.1 cobalamin-independent methionine synthase catalytic subunit [Actinomadura pelletieri DSM 43383]